MTAAKADTPPLPRTNGTDDYVFLADLITFYAANLYRGYEVLEATAFRVTRNSNLYLEEEESRNRDDVAETAERDRVRSHVVEDDDRMSER